jgi:hypothetical protein
MSNIKYIFIIKVVIIDEQKDKPSQPSKKASYRSQNSTRGLIEW